MKNLLKKFIHKFIVDDKGAVSIYLIIITLLLFFFNAVLIDFARVIIAERQTEEAANTALRSTMSSYHSGLQDKGLFGFDGDQVAADAIFQEVFAENLKNGDEDAFNLIGLKAIEGEVLTELDSTWSLANKKILEYQILEEMKYKAPVEIGESLLKDFLSIASVVEQGSNFSEVAQEVNGKAKTREENLENAEKLIKEAEDHLNDIKAKINNEEKGNYEYPEVKKIADIRKYIPVEYQEYLNRKAEEEEAEDDDSSDEDNEEGEDSSEEEEEEESFEDMKKDAEKFEANALELTEELINKVTLADDKLREALELIEEAQKLNEEIEEKVNDAESSNPNYEDAKSISEQETGADSDSLNETLEDYVMDDEFFTDLIGSVDAAIYKIDSENIRTDTLLPKLERDFIKGIENKFTNNFRRHVEKTQEYYKDVMLHIEKSLEILGEDRAEYLEDADKIEEKESESDDDRDETEEQMEDFEEMVNQGNKIAEDNAIYQALKDKANDYGEAIEVNGEEFAVDDKDETAENSMNFIDIIFNSIGDALVNARDEIYVNEYILLRFNSHDHSEDKVDPYLYKNNQVEYMIYGLPVSGANYLAALSEIFAVRFAINLAAGFLQREARGFGPYIWAYAIAFAFKMTATDMMDLTSNKPIDILHVELGAVGKIMPRMDYKDHLRLFLFIHLEGGKYERLMAVLDEETDADLREKNTYITGKATSSIKLWFLPQIADMLGKAEVINGRVEGNEFFIEKEIHYSY